MKKTRRFASLATAAILAACAVVPATMLALPVSAATAITSGSITITTEETDHHYKAYQIFDGSLSEDNGTITFADVKWGSAFGTNGGDPAAVGAKTIYEALSELNIQIDGANVFAGKTTATAVSEALAKLNSGDGVSYTDIDRVAAVFQKYLPENATGVENDTYAGGEYKINIADPGYYLVVETSSSVAAGEAISKYMLQVAGATTVTPKADAPQVMKKVKENTDYTGYQNQTVNFGQKSDYALANNYNDVADYNIGDAVPFTLYGSLPTTFANYKGYYYQFTDKLSAGLTLNAGSVKVTVTDKSGTPVILSESQYTLDTTTDGFTVTINNLKTIDMDAAEGTQVMSDDAVITVDYTATLNANAVIGLNGNPNEVFLTYSNDSNTAQGGDTDKKGKTPEDKVIVFTYEMDVTKYLDKAEDANKAAADAAGFKLYKKVGDDTYYAKLTDNKVTGWTQTEAEATEIKTVAGGLVKFIGLDDGTFYLKETTTPTGYNTMEDLEVVVDATTANNQTWAGEANAALTKLSVSYGETTNADGSIAEGSVPVSIINKSGSSLPSTGGIGTTIFYVAGGVLVVGAGVLLITKKRAKDAQ